jgi:hypothetical protein
VLDVSLILIYYFVEIVKQKGLENITVDELVQEITPKGRGKYLLFLEIFI